jgi:hypothetical protein
MNQDTRVLRQMVRDLQATLTWQEVGRMHAGLQAMRTELAQLRQDLAAYRERRWPAR